jgi:hypothetical protein
MTAARKSANYWKSGLDDIVTTTSPISEGPRQSVQTLHLLNEEEDQTRREMMEAEEVPESGGKKRFARRVLLEGPLRPYPLLFGLATRLLPRNFL